MYDGVEPCGNQFVERAYVAEITRLKLYFGWGASKSFRVQIVYGDIVLIRQESVDDV